MSWENIVINLGGRSRSKFTYESFGMDFGSDYIDEIRRAAGLEPLGDQPNSLQKKAYHMIAESENKSKIVIHETPEGALIDITRQLFEFAMAEIVEFEEIKA